MSASKIVRDIIEDFTANPETYRALSDMDGSLSGTLTVYVPDDPWYAARDVAYVSGRVPMSVIIRKGLRMRLEQEPIPAPA